MENFTNLVPMERSGSLRQSLRHARAYLDRGYNALIFPEGTRSMSGTMADFKPVIGYLALAARVGILPIYLEGTYDAFPKGSTLLKSRDVSARIGRFIDIDELESITKGLPRAEAYRLIAARVRNDVVNLRDRTNIKFDPSEIHEQWQAERRAGKLRIEASDEEFDCGSVKIGPYVLVPCVPWDGWTNGTYYHANQDLKETHRRDRAEEKHGATPLSSRRFRRQL
jgi:hypothetical protein